MFQELEQYMLDWMKEHQAVSTAVGISIEGERVYTKGFGPLGLESEQQTTAETIYGVASVTKSFTALSILILAERGLLSVEDAVIDYLPEFQLPGLHAADMKDIKIKHLLSHSSGLAPVPRREDLIQLDQHLQYLREVQVPILGKPGGYVSYCNDTFLLLGAIIQRVTGQLYRRFVTTHILDKLHMHRSTFSLEELQRFDNVSVPYNLVKGKHQQASWPTLGNYEVGGGVRSNILDLLTYAEVYGLQNQDTLEKLGVTRERLQSMWQDGFPVDDKAFYGYALEYQQEGDLTIVCHGGGQPGVSSMFGFIPEQKICIAVLCNVGGLPVRDIFIKAVEAATNTSLEQYKVPLLGQMSQNEVDSLVNNQQLLGTYAAAEGYQLELIQSGGHILVKGDLFEEQAVLHQPNILYLPKSKRKLSFFIRDGKAWAIRFGLRVLVKEGF